MRGRSGHTLVELVLVLVLLGILTSVAAPRLFGLRDIGRAEATRAEMMELRAAIAGGPGSYAWDVGALPPDLGALAENPGVPAWDRFDRTGWNGPYMSHAAGDYTTDAWDAPYHYDAGARTLSSTGGGDSIVVTF